MSENKTKQESLDFKVRSWLVRQISGKHKSESLLYKRDEAILHVIVETLHKEISKEVGDMLGKSVVGLPTAILAQMISANKHLSDLQKTQISGIIESPSAIDNSARYLG
jgi:hypothetical protein